MLAPLLATVILAQPQRLTTFDQMMTALKSGREVRVVVEYAKTTLLIDGKEERAPEAIGGMKLDAWEYFAKGVIRNDKAYVACSHTVLIAHPRYGHVYNYVRFRIYEDNSVEITARYLTTDKYEVVMDEIFRGKITNGKDKEGVALFAAG